MKKSRFHRAVTLAAIALAFAASNANAEKIGEVDTEFKLIGPDHKIVVDVFEDAGTGGGVACHVSHAKTGGISGALGLAEDTADASIACRQVGPIVFKGPIPKQESIFSAKTSILFKEMRVVRMVDVKHNSLVYLTYSTKLIDGSPKNAITSVAVDRSTPIPVK